MTAAARVNILIEGPRWAGMWTEIVADSLQQLGHDTLIHYHNVRSSRDRLALLGNALKGTPRELAWAKRFRKQLLTRHGDGPVDLFFSIQGKAERKTIDMLREHSPNMKVVCWWGDILTGKGLRWIETASTFADSLLVSSKGDYENLEAVVGGKLRYFPFGVSDRYHRIAAPSPANKKRFTSDISLVGTYYPERCALVRQIEKSTGKRVNVRGRGWRHCRGKHGQGALSLEDSLKVHALSKISLNLHHPATRNGCNMKFYEIPAAGGFQLCDAQPLMNKTALGKATATCKSPDAFIEKVLYYLDHEDERRAMAKAANKAVFESERYIDRLASLLAELQ